MTREEYLELFRNSIIDDFNGMDPEDYEFLDPEELNFNDTIANAKNLSELAMACQNAAWDWAAFVRVILSTLGFSKENNDFDTAWLNEHAYGWST